MPNISGSDSTENWVINEWVLIEEGLRLPNEFFDMSSYSEIEAQRVGWINREKYIIDVLFGKDLHDIEYNEYTGASNITKSTINEIIYGDKGYTAIRYRERMHFDEPWDGNKTTIRKLMKKIVEHTEEEEENLGYDQLDELNTYNIDILGEE